jgi:3-hydroxyisobutyrate dehydrogenase
MEENKIAKIGWVGLGNIGSVMAGLLLKAGYHMNVHDIRPEAAEKLIAAGAHWAGSPREVAETSDTIVTSLPGPPQVRAVVEGEQGLLSGLHAGCTWIEMSTTDDKEVQRLGAIAQEKGAAVLEAPVTGGLTLAKAGGITILVGGPKDVFEAQLPVLEVIGGKILHMGPLGSASVVKVISNLLALGHLIMAGEAFMLGKRAGIDATAFLEGIKASSGNSYTIETEMPLVYNGSYDVGWTMALAIKDLGLTMQLARKHSVPLEIGALIEQIFVRATVQYGEDANSTQAVKLLEDAMNVYLRAPGYEDFR